MAARDQVMSSTERAPEPTMEEILASIRRIISDDEQSSAHQEAAPQNRSGDEDIESGEGEADDEIINDIARVLSESGSGSGPASAAPVEPEEEEEDILDLTAELGGLELVEDADDVEEIELVEVAEEAPADIFNPAPGPVRFEASPEPETEFELEPDLDLVEEPPAEDLAAEASEPEPAPEPIAPEGQPAAAPRAMSASEEAASALERAIAALRAGQVPTSSPFSSFQPQPEPVFTPPPEPVFQTQPEPTSTQTPSGFGLAPSFEPVALPESVSAEELASEAEAEQELVLTEVEVEMAEDEPTLVVETIVSEPQADRAWTMTSASDWSTERRGEREEEETPHVNGGGGYHAGAQKSLEDSVKDMLRPMLKQWLDENMSRVLTAALKDELRDNPARLRGE
jgi:cell pole-organizing protein PopZ